MKDKKTLNIVLSICIAICALICLAMVVSDSTILYMLSTSLLGKTRIDWNIGGPLIGFAGIGAVLALIKIIICSWPASKANKSLGIVAIVCDVIVICGLCTIASAIGIWNGDVAASKLEKARIAILVLLQVGAPAMLMGAIGSWITVKQAAK